MKKLTKEQVKTIKARLKAGEKGVALAKEFGVPQPRISKINVSMKRGPRKAKQVRTKRDDSERLQSLCLKLRSLAVRSLTSLRRFWPRTAPLAPALLV